MFVLAAPFFNEREAESRVMFGLETNTGLKLNRGFKRPFKHSQKGIFFLPLFQKCTLDLYTQDTNYGQQEKKCQSDLIVYIFYSHVITLLPLAARFHTNTKTH